MSNLARDELKNVIQALYEPISGKTETILTVTGQSKKTVAALPGGLYRIFIPLGATVMQFATGKFATAVASQFDMPRDAGTVFTQIRTGETIAIFDAIGGQSVSITLMP